MKSIHAPTVGYNPVMGGTYGNLGGILYYRPRPFGQRDRFRKTVRDRATNSFWAQREQILRVITACRAEA